MMRRRQQQPALAIALHAAGVRRPPVAVCPVHAEAKPCRRCDKAFTLAETEAAQQRIAERKEKHAQWRRGQVQA